MDAQPLLAAGGIMVATNLQSLRNLHRSHIHRDRLEMQHGAKLPGHAAIGYSKLIVIATFVTSIAAAIAVAGWWAAAWLIGGWLVAAPASILFALINLRFPRACFAAMIATCGAIIAGNVTALF